MQRGLPRNHTVLRHQIPLFFLQTTPLVAKIYLI
jgi:hypothetical protein